MAGIKVKDFFNGRFFEIPKYQRGYAWEKRNVRELFDDINESIESNSNHYIGTLVLSKSSNDDEKFFVVDGQQRITTVTLIISTLIKNLSPDDSAYYERFYLKEGERYRITPLNRDRLFLTELLEGRVMEPENKSQRFLKEAMEEISFKVAQIEDKSRFLKSVERLEVMEFIENTEGDAIRIFQTVNDRGKPLSNMEKAKSLLIYFSNRYLSKKLDSRINDEFSDIFEIYDDIKHLGDELGVNLIRNRDFNEDNLMRYHFVTYSNENYDPTANYVLDFLKRHLTALRSSANDTGYDKMEDFINSYTVSLKSFFLHCKIVIERAKSEPKYYQMFVILNLSATLYPLIVKLEMLGLLSTNLRGKGRERCTFFDLVELIEVRVYKTRGTDPKADISRFVCSMDNKRSDEIENWLIWFNTRWMPKEEFQSHLSRSIYGNRALYHIFINYCEHLNGKPYSIGEIQDIVGKEPNIEHILSQTPNFDPIAFGFDNKEDFVDYEHHIGNLTILEKGLNSSIRNKNASEKVEAYGKSIFTMTRRLGSELNSLKGFSKSDLQERTKLLAEFCLDRWWSDRSRESALTTIVEDDNVLLQ